MKQLLPNIKMRRLITTIFAVLMMAGGFHAHAQFNPSGGGDGTESNPYVLKTPADLNALSKAFLDKKMTGYKYYKLANDIDMSEEINLTPIGGYASKWGVASFLQSNVFIGSFDGGGNAIKGLSVDVNGNSKPYVGLFGIVGQSSDEGLTTEIKNVTIEYSKLGNSAVVKVGGIAGWVQGRVSVSNCHVKFEGDLEFGEYAGGLLGYVDAFNLKVLDCSVEVIKGNMTFTQLESGGLIGSVRGKEFLIKNSYCKGDLIYTSTQTGGLIGKLTIGSVENCGFIGSLKRAGNSVGYTVGGCIGEMSNSTLENSFSVIDSIESCENVGGLVGYGKSDSDSPFSVLNCYSSGKIVIHSGNETTRHTAIGLIKDNSVSNIENVYAQDGMLAGVPDGYEGDYRGKGYDGEGKTQLYMQSGCFAQYMNEKVGDVVWYEDVDGVNNGYPIPAGLKLSVNSGSGSAPSCHPIVRTDSVKPSSTSVTAYGSFAFFSNPAQPIVEGNYGFECSKKGSGKWNKFYPSTGVTEQDKLVSVSGEKSALETEKDYELRAFVIYEGQTYYGKTIEFSTAGRVANADGFYEIWTKDDMEWLAERTSSDADWSKDKKFKLMNDIKDSVRTVIGTVDKPFKGYFDGAGHVLTVAIDKPTEDNVGVFGVVSGGLAEGCIVNLSVRGYVNGKNNVGAICGNLQSNRPIVGCCNAATVRGVVVGGIVGKVSSNGAAANVEYCVNIGEIEGSEGSGGITYSTGVIKNCLNSGYVHGKSSYGIGGKSASYCVSVGYAMHMIGASKGNCFYDKQMFYGRTASGGDSEKKFSEILDAAKTWDDWYVKDGYYPVPTRVKDNPIAKLAAVPVLFTEGEDLISNITDSILLTDKNLGGDGVTWSYDEENTDALFEKSGAVYIPSKIGESIFSVSCNGFVRRIPFKVTDFYFSGGMGTKENPYLISTKEDMEELAKRVNENKKGTASANWSVGKYFKVTADINEVKTIVGTKENAFGGAFDGDGHIISLNIDSKKENAGLFGYIDGGSVENISVSGTVKGKRNVGGICGHLKSGRIKYSSNSATITGDDNVGGICGNAEGAILGVTNIAEVSGKKYVGGLCGVSADSVCVSMNSGIVRGDNFVGGISGKHEQGFVKSIISAGQVIGKEGAYVIASGNLDRSSLVYYDSQNVPSGSVSKNDEGRLTSEMVDKHFQSYLGAVSGLVWLGGSSYNGYPRVACESEINNLAQLTVILDKDNTVNNVTRNFAVSMRDGYEWTSENGLVDIDASGKVTLKGQSGEDVLVVSKDGLSKRIEVTIPCVPFKGHVINLDSCGSVTYKGEKFERDTTFEDVIVGETYCDTFATVNIKVRKVYDYDTLVAGCNSVVFDNKTYSKDTSFVVSEKTGEGCDSIVNVTVKVFKPLYETKEDTVCDKYVYEYFNKTKIEIVRDTLFNDTVRGTDLECDSIIRTVSVTIGAKDTVINLLGCNEFELDGQTFKNDTILYDSLRTASGCDSVVIRNIRVYKTKEYTVEKTGECDSAWVRSQVARKMYSTKKELEIFSDTLRSEVCDCDSVIFIYRLGVKGLSTPRDQITPVDIIGCDTVRFDGEDYYKTKRNKPKTFTNAAGCDSIVPHNIIVYYSVFTDSVIHACDSLLYVTKKNDSLWFKESVEYRDVLKGVVPDCGCDSVWRVKINIHKTLRVDSVLTDCDSAVYIKGNESVVFYKDSVFIDTIKSKCGLCDCDSVIRTVNVKINKSARPEDIQPKTIVSCDSFLFKSELEGAEPFMIYSDTIIYDSLRNAAGCDSIIPIEIKINSSSQNDTFLIHVCDSVKYVTSDGVTNFIIRDMEIQDVLKNAAGCDSVVLLDFRVHKVKFREEGFNGCDSVVYESLGGDNIVLYGDTVFNDTLKSEVCDCDSLIKTVSVDVSYSTPASEIDTVVINACDSFVYENYRGEQLVFKASSIYLDSMKNSSGCDSIVPVEINILKSSPVTFKKVYACEKFEYVLASGKVVNITDEVTQTVTDTLKNEVGCDSVLVMDVRVVKKKVETLEPIVDCGAVSYTYFNGEERKFFRDTMFYDVLKSGECDCDSIVKVVSVKVNNATPAESIDTVYFSGCSSVVYNGVEYTESVVLHDSLLNVYGCDSIVPICINVKKESKTKIYREECVSYRYVDANNESHVFTKDTVFVDRSFKNSEGCDSLVIVDVIILPQKYDTLRYVACGEITLGDSTYTESTSWKLVPNDPCDPIKVYEVTINPVYEYFVELEGCSVVEYNGVDYSKDTAFVENNVTVLGCDSIVNVNIVVHQPTLKTLYKSSCEFVEHEGVIYTESTEVLDSYTNEFECVSPLKVVIEVLPPLYGEDRKSGCGSVWFKDSLYTQSTLVVDTLSSKVTGCDSIVDVFIDVYHPVRTIVEIDSCNQLTYKGVVYTETTYLEPDTFETVNGCDSIVEVHLLVRRCFPYPIVVNKYNWILLCNNTLMEKDFEYKAYQWYKDDQIVLGATKSYYTENKELEGCYQVGVTLENDTVLLSERICIDAEHKFELYPNPVNRGQSVYIKCGFDKSELVGARVEVFNPLGIRVRNEVARFNANDEIVVSPMTEPGTYYVKITVSDNMAFGARFIVK